MSALKVHLLDGTFELFRAFYGAPAAEAPDGTEVGATRGLLRSLAALLARPDVSHVAVAFDHQIESFRNELYPGYKTGEGIDAKLRAQFGLAEQASRALGLTTWAMVEFEADDALATAAARFSTAPGLEQVVICSPDKDLAQCVRGERVVCLDRMRRRVLDEDGVVRKFGVRPASIPDWLALVGDSSDGVPGIPRWGAKSAAAALACYQHLERIPDDPAAWPFKVRGAKALAESLRTRRGEALLFRRLATLRRDVPLEESLEDLRWRAPDEVALARLGERIGETQDLMRAVAARH